MLLKKHKNSLLSIIQEAGLDSNLFTGIDGKIPGDASEYFIVALRDSPIRFAVTTASSFDRPIYSHSRFANGFPLTPAYSTDWDSLHSLFRNWLDDVVKPYLDEISSPDLWQLLGKSRQKAKNEVDTIDPMGFFSREEKVSIRLSISDFRSLVVKNFKPNNAELKSIDARLTYLSEALDKHNKFDWRGIAINTVITIGIALSLSPEQGNHLLQLFKQVFSHFLYLPP